MLSTCQTALRDNEAGPAATGAQPVGLRILIMSGNNADAVFLAHMTQIFSYGDTTIETVARLSDGADRIASEEFDVVLLDPNLKDCQGLDSFSRLSTFVPRIPIVVVVGMEDEANAQEAVRRGAQDYLVREQITPHTLAHSLKCAVERHRQLIELRDLSMTDPLTGLLNRRGFWALADSHLRMTRRQRKRSLLLCADLDRLKDVNDTFGHDEGDRAIIRTAELLQSCFRDSDIVARFGGDEFVALAYDTDEGAEETLRTRIEKRLRDAKASTGCSYRLSLSIGTAVVTGHESSLEELLREADRALYREKEKRPARKSVAKRAKRNTPSRSRRVAADVLALVHSSY